MAGPIIRRHGFRVDEQAVSASRTRIATYLESWRERTLQNVPIAGSQDTINYLLVGLSADGHPSDQATDAQALFLMRRQAADGRWPVQTLRPPIESNDIEVTAHSMDDAFLALTAAADSATPSAEASSPSVQPSSPSAQPVETDPAHDSALIGDRS